VLTMFLKFSRVLFPIVFRIQFYGTRDTTRREAKITAKDQKKNVIIWKESPRIYWKVRKKKSN